VHHDVASAGRRAEWHFVRRPSSESNAFWLLFGAERESIRVVSVRIASAADDVDLLVIGGGITGCAVARDAAARGLSVLLVEKNDLAAGTSGRSTKLLHGGLRYLEHGHLGLVREALREREITARLAPALARPLRFVMPVRPGVFPGRLAARIGVGLYDLLSGSHPLDRGRAVSADEIAALAPGLATGWSGGVAFADRQTDDDRLTVAIARDARRRGASIRLGVAVTALTRTASGYRATCRDEDDRGTTPGARCVVNAAGPWCDEVRRLIGRSRPILRVSRGAHLVLAGVSLNAALLLPGEKRGHRLFAIPWRGAVLFGTTDVVDAADPGRELPEIEDLRLLFGEARRLFPGSSLTRRHVLSAYTGVRPLLRQGGDTLASSREHRVLDEDGLVTIAGGKLTTWRTMAVAAVDAVVSRLGRGGASPRHLLDEPLPGGDIVRPELDAVLADEMVRHADDVAFRRLPLNREPAEVRNVLPSIVSHMAARFDWDPGRCASETARVIDRLERVRRRLDEALGAL
jgi:glycerol-3-phosphate dehydrogenase